jgi:hypothetical protein
MAKGGRSVGWGHYPSAGDEIDASVPILSQGDDPFNVMLID